MLATLISRSQYYLLTGVFAVLLFLFTIMSNASSTGFIGLILTFGKFVPAALAALSAFYYFASAKQTDNADINTGLGFVIGKSVYYIGVLASAGFAFLVTLITSTTSTGFMSIASDLLSFYAAVVLLFTWANYLSYKTVSPAATSGTV